MVRIAIPNGQNMSRQEIDNFTRRCDYLQKAYGYTWIQWEEQWEKAREDDPDRLHYFALAMGQMEGA